MGQANRVRCSLLSAIVAAALFLAAAPVPSAEGLPVGELATRVASHVQPAPGKLANPPPVTFCVLNEAGVQAKGDKDEASTLLASFGDILAALLNANSTRVAGAGYDSSSAPEAGSAKPSIESCRLLGKDKSCQRCCADLGYTRQVCAKACHFIPHPGGPEPTP